MAFFIWTKFDNYTWELSMFQPKLPVCKPSQKLCRKSTALLMCHLSLPLPSAMCVIMFVIFDVNDGTFP